MILLIARLSVDKKGPPQTVIKTANWSRCWSVNKSWAKHVF